MTRDIDLGVFLGTVGFSSQLTGDAMEEVIALHEIESSRILQIGYTQGPGYVSIRTEASVSFRPTVAVSVHFPSVGPYVYKNNNII